MCGIVGATSERNVTGILIEGLRRLEYRGYDSAGVAVVSGGVLKRERSVGKVQKLAELVAEKQVNGSLGIAHTRWATHGEPSVRNAHPQVSGNIAIVHNGIIENFMELREMLKKEGYEFTSDTDTEVMVHLVNFYRRTEPSLIKAVQRAVRDIRGSYGAALISSDEPGHLVVARKGSPLVIGLGIGENFVASDQIALLPVTRRFIYLEEGDTADITRTSVKIFDSEDREVRREEQESEIVTDSIDKRGYRHFMLKEIYEQPEAVRRTVEGGFSSEHFLPAVFGHDAAATLPKVRHVKIVACGTSYHAGLVARYWLEKYAGVSCSVEIASEYRYRQSVTMPDSLFVAISQSGETADTLAAVRLARKQGYMSVAAICNVPGSTLVRESDLCFLTRAGVEIGVASTKAFLTQLAALMMLTGALGSANGHLDAATEKQLIEALKSLPSDIEKALSLDGTTESMAARFLQKPSCLFLGRGVHFPIALEGALKLKEISYIHAEGYASGELKHGPIALIDSNMPVVVVAPSDELLEKLKSNIESVRARGGELYVFADDESAVTGTPTCHIIKMPKVNSINTPLVFTVPLQLLAYHVAVIKGTDVDQPRNLAKSVTVE